MHRGREIEKQIEYVIAIKSRRRRTTHALLIEVRW